MFNFKASFVSVSIFVNIFVCLGFEDDFFDIQYGPAANIENFCFW